MQQFINTESGKEIMLIIEDLFQCHINKATCNNDKSYSDCYFVTNTCLTDEKLDIIRSITCNHDDNSHPINTFYGNPNLMYRLILLKI